MDEGTSLSPQLGTSMIMAHALLASVYLEGCEKQLTAHRVCPDFTEPYALGNMIDTAETGVLHQH
eukprot:1159817-Pelagomonas_calceolata.AAC.1